MPFEYVERIVLWKFLLRRRNIGHHKKITIKKMAASLEPLPFFQFWEFCGHPWHLLTMSGCFLDLDWTGRCKYFHPKHGVPFVTQNGSKLVFKWLINLTVVIEVVVQFACACVCVCSWLLCVIILVFPAPSHVNTHNIVDMSLNVRFTCKDQWTLTKRPFFLPDKTRIVVVAVQWWSVNTR